jgi:hypothetical protein
MYKWVKNRDKQAKKGSTGKKACMSTLVRLWSNKFYGVKKSLFLWSLKTTNKQKFNR